MAYTLKVFRDERDLRRDATFNELSDAQEIAERSVKSEGYDRAEVRDEDGELVFQYPRSLRSA